MNYKVVMAYDGTRYNGWQKQGNTDKTIQGKLEQIALKNDRRRNRSPWFRPYGCGSPRKRPGGKFPY